MCADLADADLAHKVRAHPAAARAWELLRAAPERALIALDFDGTLAPIVPDPAMARPAPGALAAIRRLAAAGVAVAIVTGRPAAVAAELLGLADAEAADVARAVVVLGQYGLETWTANSGLTSRADQATVEAIDAVREELSHLLAGAPEGTTVEDKHVALAVHVRRTAQPDAAMRALREPLAALARAHGLRLEPGRMVLEIRPASTDKGAAVEQLIERLQPAVVVYAGDDLGDLAAYDAVERARAAGSVGLLICAASQEVTDLTQRADLSVDGPDGVVAALTALADQVGAAGGDGVVR